MKVSIVIINRNRKDCLRDCLKSVFEQNFKDKEVIVVDNASTDGSIEMIEKLFKKVIIIKNPDNVGACIAKNQAIKLSRGELVWFLDNDSLILNKRVLSSSIKILEGNQHIGAVGGEAWVKDGVQKGIINRIVLGNGEIVYQNVPIGKDILYYPYFSTANFLVRKSLLYDIGGFNNIFFYLYEDVDISYQIRKRGLKLAANSESILYHRQIQDKARITNYFRLNKTRLIFMVLNFGFFYFLILPFIDAFYLFHPLKLRVLKNKTSNPDKSGGIIRLIYSYFKGAFLAYLWAYWNILKIIRSRNKNYIK